MVAHDDDFYAAWCRWHWKSASCFPLHTETKALTGIPSNNAIASPSVGSAIREVSQTCCGASWRKPNGIGIRRLDAAPWFPDPTPPSSLSGAGSPLQEPVGAGVVVGRLRRHAREEHRLLQSARTGAACRGTARIKPFPSISGLRGVYRSCCSLPRIHWFPCGRPDCAPQPGERPNISSSACHERRRCRSRYFPSAVRKSSRVFPMCGRFTATQEWLRLLSRQILKFTAMPERSRVLIIDFA
jgi:hypothetical protein